MNRKSLGALVALNVVLLLALMFVALAPVQPAHAQFNQQAYIMIAARGKNVPQNKHIIYITELSSAKMIALFYDSQREVFDFVGARPLANDLKLNTLKGK